MSPKEFATAISSVAGVANVVCFLGRTEGKTEDPSVPIPSIKDLHCFEFLDEGILARKFSGLGSGKYIEFKGTPMVNLKVETRYVSKIQHEEKLNSWRPERSTLLPYKRPGDSEVVRESTCEIEDQDNLTSTEYQQNGALFSCPRDPCIGKVLKLLGIL